MRPELTKPPRFAVALHCLDTEAPGSAIVTVNLCIRSFLHSLTEAFTPQMLAESLCSAQCRGDGGAISDYNGSGCRALRAC